MKDDREITEGAFEVHLEALIDKTRAAGVDDLTIADILVAAAQVLREGLSPVLPRRAPP